MVKQLHQSSKDMQHVKEIENTEGHFLNIDEEILRNSREFYEKQKK